MRNLLVVILAIVLCSCGRKSISTDNVIDLLATPESEITKLSDIATDVDYIPLQTTDSSLMSMIYKMIVRGNFLYFGTLNQVFCFDNSGKFLFKLDKKGRGPGEYEILGNFDINPDNTILAVISRSDILFYNQTDNGFIFKNKISLSTSPYRINFTNESDNLLLQFSNEDGTNPFSRELINLKGESLITWPNYMKYTLKDGYFTYWGYWEYNSMDR